MHCDDTIECLCSVFRNQENDTEAYRIISLQEPEYSFLDFYSLHNSSLHSFANFSIHLQLICSLIQVMNNEPPACMHF